MIKAAFRGPEYLTTFLGRGFGFFALCWRHGAEVLRQIGASEVIPLHCSPTKVAQGLFHSNVGRVYCNVMVQIYNRLGTVMMETVQPRVLDSSDITCAHSAIVIREACYGAYIDEDEDPSDAISYRFYNKEVGAFIGSTIIAWDQRDRPYHLQIESSQEHIHI